MDGSMHRVDLVITNVTQPMAKHIRVRVPKARLVWIVLRHAIG